MASPETFKNNAVSSNSNYGLLLREAMESVNPGGKCVIMTPGRYNAAFFEHSYLAEVTGYPLVMHNDLFVQDNKLYFKGRYGVQQVGRGFTAASPMISLIR